MVARPEPGFEPGTEDPQSHMLPGYTTRAIFLGDAIIEEIFKGICILYTAN